MSRTRRNLLWKALLPGDVIRIFHLGIAVTSGFIDDRTEDGDVIWVVDSIGGRRLFHVDDEFDFEVSGSIYAKES